ncbi:autotransporter outer membrane beta-barrel domain-containing protein [Fusobacterium varium]|uniref:autotransporter outer membrane beta-barrel domain-containing protein n=1 Tax=Fusobacterium varium TaxID=856 RepID=UPI000E423BD1|nr:autotransporter outer membrane beta-barrel domain-containing protein [Fusobacterium varium]RGJ22377.1 autotransporter outer membrane beta-barrel domain-containing protein [Fusobacterium varium]
MIEKIMKAVKRGNKRRSRNITIGAVIGFLLSCTAVAGADKYLYIKDDNGIQFSTDGSDFGYANPYKDAGNIWDTGTNTYVNNIALSGTNNGGSGAVYGVKLEVNSKEIKFINNGAISAESASSIAYGIDNVADSKISLINTGTISASSGGNMTSSNGINNSGTIEKLDNSGIVGTNADTLSYGINNSGTIEKLDNNGIVYGISTASLSVSSGIHNNGGKIESLDNSGMLFTDSSTFASSGSSTFASSGIYNESGTIGIINNFGISTGLASAKNLYGIWNGKNGIIEIINNSGIFIGRGTKGYGIWNDGGTIGEQANPEKGINNMGVIYGQKHAINRESGTINNLNNYGILVNGSSDAVINGQVINNKNHGLIIQNGGEGTITVGNGGNENILFYDKDGKEVKRKMTIENKNDATGADSFKGNQTNKILNALKDTYKVTGSNDKVAGSIINAYGTAVVFGDAGNNNQLTLSGTIVNGGIDGSAAILGNDNTTNGDNLILQSGTVQYTDGSKGIQNTIVNGNIDMGKGNDTLTIGDGTIVNGTLDGGDDTDTLNFGISGAKSNSSESEGVRILHNITGFENMNINTNVTLYEKTIGTDGKETALKVTGVEEINIKAGGVLNLRIDSQTIKNGRYEGHALFGNTGLKINGDISQLPDGKTEIEEIEGEKYNVGVFNLVTNGLGINSIIAMDGITLNENLFVKTNSILDKATIIKNPSGSEKEGDIKIEGKQDIFEMYVDKSKRYIKLNEIYKGIYSSEAENFNALKDILTLSGAGGDYTSVTYKDQLARLLSYLSNIYTETPYSFSSELSRKSMGMFRDIITENQFKPNLNQWLIMGGLTHRDGGTKDSYYGKNYHGFDTGTADVDVDMKLTGAYALGKYGYSENISLGVTAGGNRSEAKLPMSKVKGNSGYIGAFAENYRGNLTLKAGAGIQYSEYNANRATLGGHSNSEKYSDMTYDIYLNGRYSHNIGENLFLEPYGTLSYTYVDQEGTDEGNKVLAIETDSKSFDYTAAKVGVDIKKVIPHEKGKSTVSAGVSYTRLLTGADEENITGRFKGENATDFDILVAHKNEQSIGLNAKYALELESGILFDVKGSYSLERDSHKGTGKNRAKGEWIIGAGIGYKF